MKIESLEVNVTSCAVISYLDIEERVAVQHYVRIVDTVASERVTDPF